MAHVAFTPHLRAFFDLPEGMDVEASTLAALLDALDGRWPGFAFYVIDERKHIRKHVAIWIDGTCITDRTSIDLPLEPASRVYILQALSGG